MEIKGLPIDVSRFEGHVVMIAPRLRINVETGEPRPDKDGRPVWMVGVAMVKKGTSEAQIIDICLTSDLSGVVLGSVVELEGLEATPWTFNDRSGLAWKAESMKVVASVEVTTDDSARMAAPTAGSIARKRAKATKTPEGDS